MARIRTIKPDFFQSEDVAALQPEPVYEGPLGRAASEASQARADSEYVYFLSSAAGELVYVGRSFRPADRFTKHRRKPWWEKVSTALIVRVPELPIWERKHDPCGKNTARLEALAISRLSPTGNIAVASQKALRRIP